MRRPPGKNSTRTGVYRLQIQRIDALGGLPDACLCLPAVVSLATELPAQPLRIYSENHYDGC